MKWQCLWSSGFWRLWSMRCVLWRWTCRGWHCSVWEMVTQMRKLFTAAVWLSPPSHTHRRGGAMLAGLHAKQRPQELQVLTLVLPWGFGKASSFSSSPPFHFYQMRQRWKAQEVTGCPVNGCIPFYIPWAPHPLVLQWNTQGCKQPKSEECELRLESCQCGRESHSENCHSYTSLRGERTSRETGKKTGRNSRPDHTTSEGGAEHSHLAGGLLHGTSNSSSFITSMTVLAACECSMLACPLSLHLVSPLKFTYFF